MTDDLRASDAVDDLVDEAILGDEASTEAAVEVVTAARSEGEPVETSTAEALPAIELGTAERADRLPQPKQPKMTKAQALEELQKANAALEEMRTRMTALEARSNVSAVSSLGQTLTVAIQVAGDFLAASRGPHWTFPESDAKPMGEAWAVVAAPHAEKLGAAIPWALAIGVTWKTLKPRLDRDKELVAQAQRGDRATE